MSEVSFTASSLQILARLGTPLPVHFLVSARDAAQWLTPRLSRFLAVCPGTEIRLSFGDGLDGDEDGYPWSCWPKTSGAEPTSTS